MGICGYMWVYVGICGYMWVYCMWVYVGIGTYMWVYVGICGYRYVYVGSHRHLIKWISDSFLHNKAPSQIVITFHKLKHNLKLLI